MPMHIRYHNEYVYTKKCKKRELADKEALAQDQMFTR